MSSNSLATSESAHDVSGCLKSPRSGIRLYESVAVTPYT